MSASLINASLGEGHTSTERKGSAENSEHTTHHFAVMSGTRAICEIEIEMHFR